MDTLTAIRTRRSVRRFEDQPVEQETIRTILEAGFCAPTARNLRPWHFIVLRDMEVRRELSKAAGNLSRLVDGDCVIFVCGDREVQEREEFILEDGAAAVQNMLLAAHASGLGAVWCGIRTEKDLHEAVRRPLQLPPNILPVAFIVLGHPSEHPEPKNRYDESKVHWDRW